MKHIISTLATIVFASLSAYAGGKDIDGNDLAPTSKVGYVDGELTTVADIAAFAKAPSSISDGTNTINADLTYISPKRVYADYLQLVSAKFEDGAQESIDITLIDPFEPPDEYGLQRIWWVTNESYVTTGVTVPSFAVIGTYSGTTNMMPSFTVSTDTWFGTNDVGYVLRSSEHLNRISRVSTWNPSKRPFVCTYAPRAATLIPVTNEIAKVSYVDGIRDSITNVLYDTTTTLVDATNTLVNATNDIRILTDTYSSVSGVVVTATNDIADIKLTVGAHETAITNLGEVVTNGAFVYLNTSVDGNGLLAPANTNIGNVKLTGGYITPMNIRMPYEDKGWTLWEYISRGDMLMLTNGVVKSDGGTRVLAANVSALADNGGVTLKRSGTVSGSITIEDGNPVVSGPRLLAAGEENKAEVTIGDLQVRATINSMTNDIENLNGRVEYVKVGNGRDDTNNIVQIGYDAYAGGLSGEWQSVAVGDCAETHNAASVAVGPHAVSAGGVFGLALGYRTLAFGKKSVAIGSGLNNPDGTIDTIYTNSLTGAVGTNHSFTVAKAEGAVQIGPGINTNKNSIQFRGTTIVNGLGNIPIASIENGTQLLNTNSSVIAIGKKSSVGSRSIAVGETAVAKHNGVALGYDSKVEGGAVAVGLSANASNTYAVAIGTSSYARGFESVAIGKAARANGSYSMQLGQGTNVLQKSLQFRDTVIVNGSGKIPVESLSEPMPEGMPSTGLVYSAGSIRTKDGAHAVTAIDVGAQSTLPFPTNTIVNGTWDDVGNLWNAKVSDAWQSDYSTMAQGLNKANGDMGNMIGFYGGEWCIFDSYGMPIDTLTYTHASCVAATNAAYAVGTNMIDHTNARFSAEVLAVGLNVDTNSVAVLNEIAANFGNFPLSPGETATTVGGLLAALAAAVAWLRKRKFDKLTCDGVADITTQNGTADVSALFSSANTSLNGAIDAELKADTHALTGAASGSVLARLTALETSVNTANADLEDALGGNE